MSLHVSLITLGVEDLARAAAFYEAIGAILAQAEGNVRFYQLSGVVLSLYPRNLLAEDAQVAPEGSGFAGVTLACNLASSEEVDTFLAQAVEAGARLVKPGQKVFWGGYSGYFADPDGHLWEVAHNPFWTLDEGGIPRLTA